MRRNFLNRILNIVSLRSGKMTMPFAYYGCLSCKINWQIYDANSLSIPYKNQIWQTSSMESYHVFGERKKNLILLSSTNKSKQSLKISMLHFAVFAIANSLDSSD